MEAYFKEFQYQLGLVDKENRSARTFLSVLPPVDPGRVPGCTKAHLEVLQQIRDEKKSGQPDQAASVLRAAQISPPPDDFVGREAELEKLRAMIGEHSATITRGVGRDRQDSPGAPAGS